MAAIYIADASGANQVWLLDDQEPSPVPFPVQTRRVTEEFMRPGLTAPGLRIVDDEGSSIGYADLKFSCRYVSQENLAALRAKFDAYQDGGGLPVEVSLDAGTTKWLCAWAEDGLVPKHWDLEEQRYEVDFHLKVLGIQGSFGS